MKNLIEKAHYGNCDISGGVDALLLSVGLKVSPNQQIEFLKKLQGGRLPFSNSSMNILKDIMIVDSKLSMIYVPKQVLASKW
jgi:beta-lactamase class D